MLSGSFALASGAHGGWATSLAMDSCEAGSDARQRASVTRTEPMRRRGCTSRGKGSNSPRDDASISQAPNTWRPLPRA